MTMGIDTTTNAARAAYDKAMFYRKYLAPHSGSGGTDEDGRVYHRHHIAPKSLFPDFDKEDWNLVRLSIEEHIQAHQFLIDASDGDDKLAMARALACMTQMFRDASGHIDIAKAEEAARIANEGNSRAQTRRLKERWRDPGYKKKKSDDISDSNRRNWKKPTYRAHQPKAIARGRQRRFKTDPAFKKDVYRRQALAISGRKHFNWKPANIYCGKTAKLVAENVCIREWCESRGLHAEHLYVTASADATEPSTRENKTRAYGYFARYLDSDGRPMGTVVPTKKKRSGKIADLYRYEDDSLVAEGIIVRDFVKTPFEGTTLNQGALSRTGHADRNLPSSRENPHHHKGYYIKYRYEDDS